MGIRPSLAHSCREISKLRRRVQWLESIVRNRLPDVDLSREPDQAALDSLDESQITVDSSTIMVDVDAAPVPASQSPPPEPPTEPLHPGLLTHEIGLVSLNSTQDPRYIGPSSGYFLARVLLAGGKRRTDDQTAASVLEGTWCPLPSALLESLQEPVSMPPLGTCKKISAAYFEALHPLYPIIHPGSFVEGLERYISGEETDPVAMFQAFMVLALGAVVLSQRHRVRLPAESYCLSALQYWDRLNIDNSLRGLQCLLLILLFAMHCPNMRLNVWYLNYQCIAAVLDLGLQRDIKAGSGRTRLDIEIRARLFWVVMMLDRKIATTMGRPIGLRDEACDLRVSF